MLKVVSPDGSSRLYPLGPHTPGLRPQDLELLHQIWLRITSDREFAGLHHYHVVALALRELQRELEGPGREQLLDELNNELRSGGDHPGHRSGDESR